MNEQQPCEHCERPTRGWLRGWAATLRIMIFERDTYRFLRDCELIEGDFVEVEAPECNLCPTPCSGCEKWER